MSVCPYCECKFELTRPHMVFCKFSCRYKYNWIRQLKKDLYLSEHDRKIWNKARQNGFKTMGISKYCGSLLEMRIKEIKEKEGYDDTGIESEGNIKEEKRKS